MTKDDESVVSENTSPIGTYFDSTDEWAWNCYDKSHEVMLTGVNGRTAVFHPNWSNGSAGVRATRSLYQGYTYWEIRVSERVFGTSLMFGVATSRARLHANSFLNLLGEDQHGWALSHKGYLFHKGRRTQYTEPFAENTSTTIGILYDSNLGTLTYYKDGVSLGIAFAGLNKIEQPLYPAICSTAARTEMTLVRVLRNFLNLQDQCRSLILALTGYSAGNIDNLLVPRLIQSFLKEPLYLDNEDHASGPVV